MLVSALGTLMRSDAALLTGRLLGAGLTVAMGAIHLWLWLDGYRDVPVLGMPFLINAVCSVVLAVTLLAAPARLRAAVIAVAAVFTAGTLAALITSLTVGLFGIHESLQTPLVPATLIIESAGVLVFVLVLAAELDILAEPRDR
jgi:hypothetical protein